MYLCSTAHSFLAKMATNVTNVIVDIVVVIIIIV